MRLATALLVALASASIGASATEAAAQQPPPGAAPPAPVAPPPGGGPWFQPQPGAPPAGPPAGAFPAQPPPAQPPPGAQWAPQPGDAYQQPPAESREAEASRRREEDRRDRESRRREPPARLDWQKGDPIPPGYMTKTRPNVGLLITGAVLFGATYLPSLGIAVSDEDDEFLPLAIPVAGPFVTIGTARAEGAGTFWLAVDGMVQATGVTMFIVSLAAEKSYLRRVAEAPSTVPAVAVGPGSIAVKGAF